MYNVDEFVKDILGKDLTLCRDYPSIVKWDVEKIEKWTDSWTDFNITDPGILFINADAYLYDIINLVLDNSYENNLLRYTQSLQSLYMMSKFAGLTLPGYYCATANVTITNPLETNVTIPRDFEIYVKDSATNDTIYFYSLTEFTVNAGLKNSGSFIEGSRTEINTTFAEFYNNSNFEFIIPTEVVGLNSIFVYANFKLDSPGEFYDTEKTFRKLLQVDDALLNLADEPCFSAYYAQNKVVIQLCPGIGDFFNSETEIKIFYGTPFGVNANTGTVLAKPLNDLYDATGTNIAGKLTYTVNYATGASIPYELEETRIFIGNNVWRPETLIVNADFDNLQETQFTEVAWFTVEQASGSEVMKLWVAPNETDSRGETMTTVKKNNLLADIYDYCKDLMFGEVQLDVELIGEVELDFVIEVALSINTSDTTSLTEEIKTILNTYLDRETQGRNMYFRRSKVITLLEDNISEIYSVSLTYPITDRKAENYEMFVLGEVTIHYTQHNAYSS